MGPVTYVNSEQKNGQLEVTVLTRFTEEANSRRVMLNYAAGRAAGHTSLKQRALIAAAAEEHDLAWREGPFKRNPLQVFPEAEDVDYEFNIVSNEEFGRVAPGETRFQHKWILPLEEE